MTIKLLITAYLRHLKTIGRSPRTLTGRRYDLNEFLRYLDKEGVVMPEELTSEIMKEYQEDLAFRITTKGKPLASRSQAQLLGVAKGFTRYLKENDYILYDPGEKIKVPRKPKRLPKVILSSSEVNTLINTPDTRTNQGYRDRIILEILYDTAIRRAEISDIKIADIDLDAGYIHVTGKGDKDRVVPLSQRVCELVKNYLLFVRPSFIKGEDPGYLILNRWGEKMFGNGIWCVVKRQSKLAGINKSVSTHTFRHTCATHMLRNGAPVRHIQEMLGHESLESTQIYTRVTINDLKAVHSKYHPSDTLEDKDNS